MSKLQEAIKRCREELPFTIDDGVLTIWEMVPPDGDWEGREATIEDLKAWIVNYEQNIIETVVEAVVEEIKDVLGKEKKIDKKYSTDERRYPHGYNAARREDIKVLDRFKNQAISNLLLSLKKNRSKNEK